MLGNLLGKPSVYVALVFQSDGVMNLAEGAYVDNLVVRKCAGGVCPAGAAARAGSAVTMQARQLVRR